MKPKPKGAFMLATQKEFLEYLEQVDTLAQKAKIEKSKANLIASIKERELLVPVVGGFSAGKSTALNAFLGEDILSVAITPETALATELRYTDGQSYAEGVKDNDSVEKIAINALDSLKDRAGEFKYIKLYLNNPKLKQIAPLILVDMPGFDAPLELHNKAIMEYLARGIYFIILESAESGTIAMSIKKHIDNLKTLGRDFSFCLSKVDLRLNEIDEIKQHIAQDLEIEFGYDKPITLLDKNTNRGESLEKLVAQVNVEQIFENLYKDELKMDFVDTKGSLQTKIAGFKATKDEADSAVKELGNAIETITKTKESLANKSFDADSAVESTLNAVDRALIGDKESLANVVVRDQKSFANTIAEIIRGTLLGEFTRKGKEQRERIITAYKAELSELNMSSAFSLDSSWVNGVIDNISTTLEKTSIGSFYDYGENIKKFGKAFVGVAQILQTLLRKIIIFPWLKIVLSVAIPIADKLVNVLAGLLGGKKVDADKLIAEVSPQIRNSLKPEIAKAYKEQIEATIEAIYTILQAKFEEKQEEIKKAQSGKGNLSAQLDSEIQNLSEISANLDSLATKYLYK